MKFLGKDKINEKHSRRDTWIYYSPSDVRCCLFDFSYIDKGKIILSDGLQKSHDKVRETSLTEFINEYGDNLFLSTIHWKVTWNNGFTYNN